MVYCTVTDLINAKSDKILANQTDDLNGKVINNTIINSLIGRAAGIIDGYLLSAGLSLPLATVPNILQDLSIRLTIYFLYSRSHTVPDAVKDDYNSVLAILKKIASGELVIKLDTGKAGIKVATMYDNPKFTDKILE